MTSPWRLTQGLTTITLSLVQAVVRGKGNWSLILLLLLFVCFYGEGNVGFRLPHLPLLRAERKIHLQCLLFGNLFGNRDQFHGRRFFHGLAVEGAWFWDDSSVLHLLCTLFLLLLCQLPLRSAGIRSQRLGDPALTDPLKVRDYRERFWSSQGILS